MLIGQPPFYHAQADAEDAQIAAVGAIHQAALATPDDPRAQSDQPHIDEGNQQGQP